MAKAARTGGWRTETGMEKENSQAHRLAVFGFGYVRLWQEIPGVDVAAVVADFKVQVRTGGIAGAA